MERTVTIAANANTVITIPVEMVYIMILRIPFRVLHFIMSIVVRISEMEGTHDAALVFAPRRVYTTMITASISAATDAEYQVL